MRQWVVGVSAAQEKANAWRAFGQQFAEVFVVNPRTAGATKPRIRWSSVLGCWQCLEAGKAGFGAGNTPQVAYLNWQMASGRVR